ncbi:MAG: glycosyltransferase family 2 protein, partial [Deltaproteobacteria bacterium]
RAIDDYPSCNLLVRKDAFLTLGGFRTKFWPGEDTVLCLGIVRELGLKIVYDPAVLVYHHRRALFGPHLRQIASYATHRGYFVKRFPQTSLRWAYFMPSLFLAFLLAGPFILPRPVFMAFIGAYAALVAAACLRDRRTAGLVFLGIVASHATYGLYFMRGLLTPRLAEEKTNNT